MPSLSRTLSEWIVNLRFEDLPPDVIDREIITVRNEAWEDGLKFNISGGDNQVVLKLVKR